ncbi:MAG: hypothetical protein AAFU61_17375, partial [Pseudomonadota bacterium]
MAGSAGGGLYFGIAGSILVNAVDSDVAALITDGAQINQRGAGDAARGVSVTALNRLDITTIAGALGVAILGGGVGASVDVGIIRSDVNAAIAGAGTRVLAEGEVDVAALTDWRMDSKTIAFGAGAVGIGGGITVYSVGGEFTDDYESGEQGVAPGSALDGEDGDVQSFADETVFALVGALTGGGDQTASFDPRTAADLDLAANTIDVGDDVDLRNGDLVVYDSGAGAAIGGLVDGRVYFVIVDDPENAPNVIRL